MKKLQKTIASVASKAKFNTQIILVGVLCLSANGLSGSIFNHTNK